VSILCHVQNHSIQGAESHRDEVEKKIANGLRVLLDEGVTWREITVEKIAEAAGIKRTLFYVYYPDRAAVLIRLGEEIVTSTITGISNHFFVDTSGSNVIREELSRFIEMMHGYRSITKALMDGAAVDESLDHFWRGLVRSFVEPTQRWIEDLQQSGGASKLIDAEMTAFCLVVMTGRVALHPIATAEDTKDSLFEAVVAIWTNSLYAS